MPVPTSTLISTLPTRPDQLRIDILQAAFLTVQAVSCAALNIGTALRRCRLIVLYAWVLLFLGA
jgi:hypothetical protein